MKGLCYVSVLGAGLALLISAWPSAAHRTDGAQEQAVEGEQGQPRQETLSRAHGYFTDVVLVNQYGEQMRLYSDLLKGKVVVIHSFFTSCEASCPVTIGSFARLQAWLGERLGRDVHLLSISVDPVTDTPAKLKAYAEQLKVKRGWYLLSGEPQNVKGALYKLGQYVETKEDHHNIIIMGNEPTGLWKKTFGLAQPQDLIQLLESVLQDPG
jgi:protein SCO1/2